MREIKYRVWCKNNNEWEKDQVAILPNGRILHFIKQFPSMVVKAETHIIQFYTGLRDKNGKEIYEGDILQWYGERHESKRNEEVIFSQGCFEMLRYGGFTPLRYFDLINSETINAEIIGNKFQNEELLNDSQNTKTNTDS